MIKIYFIETPVGVLEAHYSDEGVHALRFAHEVSKADMQPDHKIAQQLQRELDEYFAGVRQAFSLPLVLGEEGFAAEVLETLLKKVPFGTTVTYGDLALAAGSPRAARAVGSVMRKNKHLLLIPCHRVVPKSGGVGEYAGRSAVKKWLLQHEKQGK